MVVGAAHHDPPEYGVQILVAVAHKLRVMAGAAVDVLAAVPGVGGQQPLQQLGAQVGHRGADRQLHGLQAVAGGVQPLGRQRGQPFYLGRELGRDLLAEPLFHPPSRPGAPWPPGWAGAPHRSPH